MNGAPILVFAGPSLPPVARPKGPFEWHPPAMAGDLVRLLDRPPAKLCLIDGFFDFRPAPWHKEILALMARGTILFGASSMGALRAAELQRFGMIGVGTIFRAYRDGRLTGDDEVALIHAPGALDWAPLSVPMVEIRATLIAACRAKLIDVPSARRLRAAAHAVHFTERDWPRLGKAFAAEGLANAAACRRLQATHVLLKRQDALSCLAAARRWADPARPCAPAPDTIFIRRLAEEMRPDGSEPAPPPAPPSRPPEKPRPAPATAGGGA